MYLLFILPGLLFGIIAQIYLKSSFGHYSKVDAGTHMTGMQAAELLNARENFGVDFVSKTGTLSDYFDPVKHVVNISSDNVSNSSVANIAVVAHEFGHVQQKLDGAKLFNFRSSMVPIVNFGSGVGYILIIIGLMIASIGLTWLGVILFSSVSLFALVTLPLELDASRRGMKLIEKHNLITQENFGGAKVVLRAAALTYLAGLVQSLGQLAYFAMLASQQNRRN